MEQLSKDFHSFLGYLSLAQGDLTQAIQVYDQGLTLCRASGNRNTLPMTAAGLGYAYALQGRLAEGCALLEEGISESLRTGARSQLVAHCHHGLGRLYSQTSQREQARIELLTAITMYQSMGMTFWLPQTEAVLAQMDAR
jgi:tetratricopeptide (TPR) repeat protein